MGRQRRLHPRPAQHAGRSPLFGRRQRRQPHRHLRGLLAEPHLRPQRRWRVLRLHRALQHLRAAGLPRWLYPHRRPQRPCQVCFPRGNVHSREQLLHRLRLRQGGRPGGRDARALQALRRGRERAFVRWRGPRPLRRGTARAEERSGLFALGGRLLHRRPRPHPRPAQQRTERRCPARAGDAGEHERRVHKRTDGLGKEPPPRLAGGVQFLRAGGGHLRLGLIRRRRQPAQVALPAGHGHPAGRLFDPLPLRHGRGGRERHSARLLPPLRRRRVQPHALGRLRRAAGPPLCAGAVHGHLLRPHVGRRFPLHRRIHARTSKTAPREVRAAPPRPRPPRPAASTTRATPSPWN